MSLSAKEQFKLRKLIKELSHYRGRHTELVTVYIPAGYEMNKITTHLQQEQGTATNIKSASTRKNVIDALERMIQHLKLYKQTPPNGLCVFSGNVAEREGQSDVKVWSFEPPVPLKQRIYRCDKTFVLDAMSDMLEVKEVYGLVVLDMRDADLALLKGKTIIPLQSTHSEVPGKHKTGGQCLTKDTLIQTTPGDIIQIAKSHNPVRLKSMTKKFLIKDRSITDKWNVKKSTTYKIITKNPRLEVECSKDHVFFVRSDEIEEIPAEQLKEGDHLLMPEIINVVGKVQKLNKKDFVAYSISKNGLSEFIEKRKELGLSQKKLAALTQLGQSTISAFERGILDLSENVLKRLCKALSLDFNNIKKIKKKEIKLPATLTKDVARFVGYYLGDGSKEAHRITFFEQRKDVAEKYYDFLKKLFTTNITLNFRKSKNYYQIRLYGQPIVKLLEDNFPELIYAMNSSIPQKILESPKTIVAAFLRGLFDAEGYLSGGKIGIGMNNKQVIQASQMLLLRFGIISSFLEYDNRKNNYSNNPRYSLEISEKKSLEFFKQNIDWTAKDKAEKLRKLIRSKSDRSNNRQILPRGRKIRKIIENAGYNLELFPKVSSYFNNNREMSKTIFENSIIKHVKDTKLRTKLQNIVGIPILPVKINKIIKTKQVSEMIDISVKDQSFIANGLIVHNSAQRFERLRDEAAMNHYKKIAEYMKNQFLNLPNLKGIILGGPGSTVNTFLGKNYITGDVKKKIIGVKDLSYTGDFGLQELLEKSADILSEEEVAKEKAIMQKFFEYLSTKQGMVSYGKEHVKKHLEMGAVDTLLLSEELDDASIEEFEEIAENLGTNVEIISTETREGVQLKDIGMVAAILRYEVES